MKLAYTVSKEKGSSRYYAHEIGCRNSPLDGSAGDKKRALHAAADAQGVPFKEFMKLWRKAGLDA